MKADQGLVKPGLILLTALMVTLMSIPVGCTPARKLLPHSDPRPRLTTDTYPTRNPAIGADEKNGLNTKLSDALNRIKGIERSTVIVIGTSAYAGLDLEADTTKSQFEALRPEVKLVIRRTEPRIRTVWTTAHPVTVRKIERVRADVRAGKPASTYASDLRTIINDSELVK